jgi:hypothetical protein
MRFQQKEQFQLFVACVRVKLRDPGFIGCRWHGTGPFLKMKVTAIDAHLIPLTQIFVIGLKGR